MLAGSRRWEASVSHGILGARIRIVDLSPFTLLLRFSLVTSLLHKALHHGVRDGAPYFALNFDESREVTTTTI